MTFQDIFKSGFLENTNAISIFDMAAALILSFAVGLFIFYIYKKSYCGLMYSAAFGATLVALTLITTLLILAVTSNVVLSLGMVGALSIVRFRTAIKEPMDIAFLFFFFCFTVHHKNIRPFCIGGRFYTAGCIRKRIYRTCPFDFFRT